MECLVSLIVVALAFFGAVAFGAYVNYRWMKRITENHSPKHCASDTSI